VSRRFLCGFPDWVSLLDEECGSWLFTIEQISPWCTPVKFARIGPIRRSWSLISPARPA